MIAHENDPDHAHENCRYLLGALSDYVDDAASEEICTEIERHLKDCENCRVVVDTLRKTVSLVHACTEDAEMPSEVRERLYKTLHLEDLLQVDRQEAKT